MELSDGTLFARDFRILRRLDSGGMGAVYVALQESTGMERAVKVMHPQLVTDPSLRKRFEQEARVASRIASEHVVQVVGAGVDDATGAPFLAMELLRGESLAQHLSKRGAMTLSETREFLVQLTHALGAAHAAGVVHRDLKPENLFLAEARRADAQFTVKVLDFGIAKIVADAVTTGTAALGSPIWMAPEQTSRGTLIAPATDVWALGLIVFRMLTGHLFWREAEHPQGSMTGLLREVLLEPIGTASARASEQGAGYRLPPGFDSWFARCVVREPNARFRDAVEAFRGIDGLLRMVTSGGVAATVLDPSTPSALARSGTEIAIPPWQPPLLSKRSRVGLWVGLVAGGLGLLVLIGGLLVFFSAGDSDTDEALQSSIRRGREPGYVQPATVRASAFVEKSRQESWGPELAFDNDPDTAWKTEPVPGEWIEAELQKPTRLVCVEVHGGFDSRSRKVGDRFPQYAHAKRLRLELDGQVVATRAVGRDERRVRFEGLSATAKVVRVVVVEVYPGSKWKPLALSEVEIFAGTP